MTEGPLTRLTRGMLLAAAAVVLLALVTVAAGGYRLGGSHSGRASPYAIDTLVSVALGLYAVAAVGVLAGLLWVGLDARRSKEAEKGNRRRSAMVIVLIIALLVAASSGRFHFRLNPLHHNSPSQSSSGGGTQSLTKAGKPAPSHQPRVRILPLALVFGAVGVGLLAFLHAERRRKERLSSGPAVAGDLVEALEVSLEDLRAERDPRRAVIAAYARMEAALAAHGIPRRRFEAPHEYLARVLEDLTHGGRSARLLTKLFERARFSPHEIAPPLKDEAIAALEGLQAELAAAELERAA